MKYIVQKTKMNKKKTKKIHKKINIKKSIYSFNNKPNKKIYFILEKCFKCFILFIYIYELFLNNIYSLYLKSNN
jgi:hypothetical protein